MKTKPIHHVKLGPIKAAIWRNQGEGGVRFNTTFARRYKDGEQYKSTDSFGRDDLLLLAKAADLAHSWIFQRSQEERDAAKPSTATESAED